MSADLEEAAMFALRDVNYRYGGTAPFLQGGFNFELLKGVSSASAFYQAPL